nr:putative integron gene cassette protein [uncultured bacterium]
MNSDVSLYESAALWSLAHSKANHIRTSRHLSPNTSWLFSPYAISADYWRSLQPWDAATLPRLARWLRWLWATWRSCLSFQATQGLLCPWTCASEQGQTAEWACNSVGQGLRLHHLGCASLTHALNARARSANCEPSNKVFQKCIEGSNQCIAKHLSPV